MPVCSNISDIPTIYNIPIIIQISSSLWFQKCLTLGVWQCLDIPDIPNIPDIPLFLPLWTFPTVSNIPIIQIISSLWFQICMTLGVWHCPDIPNIPYIPDIPLFLPFLPLRTFPIYYHAKSEGPSSKIG